MATTDTQGEFTPNTISETANAATAGGPEAVPTTKATVARPPRAPRVRPRENHAGDHRHRAHDPQGRFDRTQERGRRRTDAPRRHLPPLSTQPKTRVKHVQVLAERAVLVQVGVGLLARDNVVSTVKGLAVQVRHAQSVEREFRRFERRGATARNRFERQVRRTRKRFERELRQRRSRVERTVRQNRRRVEREVRSVRKDLEKQSGTIGARFDQARLRSPGAVSRRSASARSSSDTLPPPAPQESATQRDRFAGLISSPADAAPSPPSTAGASRK